MPKPRILVLMHYMELGGAEISLVGLLGALDPERVDVDLFVYDHRGPLMRFIPQWVNLLPQVKAYSMIERPMTEALRRGAIGVVAGRLLARWKHRRWRRRNPAPEGRDDASVFQFVGDCVTPRLPRINPGVTYDLCISFLTPHNIGLTRVNARKRIAWIHTDYATVSVNATRELPVWQAYDHIASISPDVTRSFLQTFPTLGPKIIEIENILSPAFVRSRAEEFDASVEMGGVITLLSIGRYAYQKNFDNLPEICSILMKLLSIGRYCTAKNYDNVPDVVRRMLTDHGAPTDLKWYIIGYGDDTIIRQRIAEAGMQEHVILLGKKENPYPYIKACDIYVQPSRYEGKSVTVREAQMLCKPVAVTAYPTAASQIRHGVDGVIVPLDNEGCARGLARFIANTTLQQRLTANLASMDFGNESEVNRIYELLNS